jgi:hypothetical protein
LIGDVDNFVGIFVLSKNVKKKIKKNQKKLKKIKPKNML